MTRIETLSALTKGIHTLLDIGTDHGYVIIDALNHGYIKKAIACDINPMPLENAKKNIENANYLDQVNFALTDGFKGITQDYDGVLIAGMGMHLVKDILSQPHAPARKYILQANNHVDTLRAYLGNNHFKITDEMAIFDKFHYVIIVCEKGEMTLSDKDIYTGPILKHKTDALPYYEHQLNILMRNYSKANGQKQLQIGVKVAYLSEIIESLKE